MSNDQPTRRRRPLRSIVRRFRKNADGATAVEFGMVSVPFLGLLFAIFESAYVFFVTEALESAVADAGRKIMTGQTLGSAYTGASAASNFRDGVLCTNTATSGTANYVLTGATFLNCSNLTVDVRTAGKSGSTSFTTTGTGASALASQAISSAVFCPGSQNDVVVMRIMYDMPVYLPIIIANSLGDVTVDMVEEPEFGRDDRQHLVACRIGVAGGVEALQQTVGAREIALVQRLFGARLRFQDQPGVVGHGLARSRIRESPPA